MREQLNQWDFVIGAYAVGLVALICQKLPDEGLSQL